MLEVATNEPFIFLNYDSIESSGAASQNDLEASLPLDRCTELPTKSVTGSRLENMILKHLGIRYSRTIIYYLSARVYVTIYVSLW